MFFPFHSIQNKSSFIWMLASTIERLHFSYWFTSFGPFLLGVSILYPTWKPDPNQTLKFQIWVDPNTKQVRFGFEKPIHLQNQVVFGLTREPENDPKTSPPKVCPPDRPYPCLPACPATSLAPATLLPCLPRLTRNPPARLQPVTSCDTRRVRDFARGLLSHHQHRCR